MRRTASPEERGVDVQAALARRAADPRGRRHAQHGQCPRRERARTERHRVDDPGKADHLLVRLAADRQAGRADHHQHRKPAGRRDAGVRDHAAAAAREGHSRLPAGRPRRRAQARRRVPVVRRGGAQPGAALERRARRRNDQAGHRQSGSRHSSSRRRRRSCPHSMPKRASGTTRSTSSRGRSAPTSRTASCASGARRCSSRSACAKRRPSTAAAASCSPLAY